MDSHKKIPSSIRGFYSAAEEFNDDKCIICYLELPEPVVQTICGHRFCRDCMMRTMRYDANELMYQNYLVSLFFPEFVNPI